MEGEKRKEFRPLDLAYKPINRIDQNIDFYFSKLMRKAYRVVSNKKNGVESTTADQCFACNKLFIEKKSLENHKRACSSMPGLVYKFENQNILTFEENVKFMGDLPFAIYFDF